MSTGRPPAAEVASMTMSASPEPSGRCTGTATPVDVSLCAHAMTSTDGSDCGLGALPGSALMIDRVADERVLGDRGGELRAELAVGQVQRALVDEPERRGVPERRRAAVAEDHLVAVGQREQLPDARRGPGRPGSSPVPAGARCRTGRPRRPAPASCSGRTFDGPQPNRPSRGFEVGGNRQFGHAVKSSDRTCDTFCGRVGVKTPRKW